jgi:PRTRC genetic system protein B
MKNVSQQFNDQYRPIKALLVYQSVGQEEDGNYHHRESGQEIYVESYDIGKQGNPINAHPLTIPEMQSLSELLQSTQELKGGYLKSRGLLPGKVIYINPLTNGFAVWYTAPQEMNLFFVDSLGIPSGKVHIPAMVWKASKDRLDVFAIKGKSKPTAKTALYHAPYFNIHYNGNVCMGTVVINIDRNTALEDFMTQWESYFFNSYFSHTIHSDSSTKINIVQLWQEQVATGRDFPQEVLVKSNTSLNHLIR